MPDSVFIRYAGWLQRRGERTHVSTRRRAPRPHQWCDLAVGTTRPTQHAGASCATHPTHCVGAVDAHSTSQARMAAWHRRGAIYIVQLQGLARPQHASAPSRASAPTAASSEHRTTQAVLPACASTAQRHGVRAGRLSCACGYMGLTSRGLDGLPME